MQKQIFGSKKWSWKLIFKSLMDVTIQFNIFLSSKDPENFKYVDTPKLPKDFILLSSKSESETPYTLSSILFA